MAPKRKNGFLLFCEDYRQQHSEGASNMSLKAATEIAGPLWNVCFLFFQCIVAAASTLYCFCAEINRI